MRTMLLLTATLLVACNGGGVVNAQPDAAPALPATVTLRLNEAVTWSDLELRWVDFEDSRCPTGVNCVWAGRLRAVLEISRASDSVRLELINHLKSDPPPASAFSYQFRLLGMQPRPKDGVEIADSARTLRLGIRRD